MAKKKQAVKKQAVKETPSSEKLEGLSFEQFLKDANFGCIAKDEGKEAYVSHIEPGGSRVYSIGVIIIKNESITFSITGRESPFSDKRCTITLASFKYEALKKAPFILINYVHNKIVPLLSV